MVSHYPFSKVHPDPSLNHCLTWMGHSSEWDQKCALRSLQPATGVRWKNFSELQTQSDVLRGNDVVWLLVSTRLLSLFLSQTLSQFGWNQEFIYPLYCIVTTANALMSRMQAKRCHRERTTIWTLLTHGVVHSDHFIFLTAVFVLKIRVKSTHMCASITHFCIPCVRKILWWQQNKRPYIAATIVVQSTV